jgi:hypothetical protein
MLIQNPDYIYGVTALTQLHPPMPVISNFPDPFFSNLKSD